MANGFSIPSSPGVALVLSAAVSIYSAAFPSHLSWLFRLLFAGFGLLFLLGAWRVEQQHTARDPAAESLRKAYAEGDLSSEEFHERREILNGDSK